MNTSNRPLDLNDVALFVQVVAAGSFAEAARRLGMPPNTVSRRIQSLEAQLGARLLQRSTRKLVLTEAGSNFHLQSAGSVEALLQSAQSVAEGGRVPSGRLRIAAPADFSNWFPMTWIAEFLGRHPRVRIEFVLSDARADLISEAIDLAFRAGRALEPQLVARRIGTSRLSLFASPDYLARRGTPRHAAELAQHDCVLRNTPHGRDLLRLDTPDGPVEVEVTGRFAANTMRAVLDGAIAGLGIALLPASATVTSLAQGLLLQVLPGHGQEGVGVHFAYLSRRQLPPAVSAFMDFATERMRDAGLVD